MANHLEASQAFRKFRLLAGVAAFALLLPASACSSGKSILNVENSSHSRSASSPTTSQKLPNVVPGWVFPTSIDGWTVDLFGHEGKNRAISPAGCYLATGEHTITGTLTNDRSESERELDRFVQAMRANGLTDVQTRPTTPTEVKAFNGGKVEGLALEISYTGKDGKAYRGWYWLRTFTNIATPVLLQINYTCPVQAYSSDELTSILDGKISLKPASPARLDG